MRAQAPTQNPFTRPNPFTAAAAPAPARTAERASSFERRFLSETYRGGAGMLEIAAMWRNNVVAVDSYREAKAPVTLGARGATYLVESTSLDAVATLVEPCAGGWTLHVQPGMEGFVVAPGRDGRSRRLSFEEAVAAGLGRRGATPGAFAIGITGTTRARVAIGEQSFLVHYVSAPALRLPLAARVGLAGLAVAVTLSLGAHLTFGALVSLSTDRVEELTIDQLVSADRFGDTLVQPLLEEDEVVEVEPEFSDADSKAAISAKLGERSAPTGEGNHEQGPSDASSGGPRGGGERGGARAEAMEAGLLPSLNAFATQTGDAADFNETLVAWGDFDSGAPGLKPGYGLDAANSGCIGLHCNESVSGPGGPGGDPGLSTGGKGDPKGDPDGIGPQDVLGDHVKETRKPVFTPQRFDSSGQLTAKQIRKVVNAHKNELKGLYEKALLRKKGLHGKVVVQFIVDGQGNVVSASVRVLSTTMNEKSVEDGLVAAVKRWRFPAVKDGGLTKVSYPFVFDVK